MILYRHNTRNTPPHERFTFADQQGLNILPAMRIAPIMIALPMVLAMHGLVLYGITRMPEQTPTPPLPPVVQGKLISIPPVAPVAPPKPLLPKPVPPKPSPAKPKPEPVKQAKTPPIPVPEKVLAVDTPAITDNALAATPEPAPPQTTDTPPDSPVAEPVVTPPRIDARSRDNPPPDYPRMSRRMGHEGTVMLEVYILENGQVGKVRLKQTSGYDRLDEAAMAAVKKWRYEPARRGDEPISFWYTQAVKFVLN